MTPTGSMLAPAPGPHHGPGTGANTAPGFPGIFDPWRVQARDSAFIRARDGYLVTIRHDPDPPEYFAASDFRPGAYDRWLDHIWAAAGCTHPIRLGGQIHHVDPCTGEISSTLPTSALPDGVIYKACGNRRVSACPSCAETYRRDAFQLIRAGLIGGKGVPAHVAGHPAVFATFTAPSFGPVHSRPVPTHTCMNKAHCRCQPQPCHARRDTEICPHGRKLACFTRHRADDPRLGQPLCPDCYDYPAHVVWNNHTGELWRRTKQAIERHLNQARPPPRPPLRGAGLARQSRRIPGPRRGPLPRPAPPRRPRRARSRTAPAPTPGHHRRRPRECHPTCRSRHHLPDPAAPGQPPGWFIAWGDELDVRSITVRGTATVTDLMVAAYLAKYSTKGTEVTGHASKRLTPATVDLYANATGTHAERLIHACWRLGRNPGYASLRRWAHMLGFGGHFLTKARHYSVTFATCATPGSPTAERRLADRTTSQSTAKKTSTRKPRSSLISCPTPEPAGKPSATRSWPAPPPTKPADDSRSHVRKRRVDHRPGLTLKRQNNNA